jgi:hypothetical protein
MQGLEGLGFAPMKSLDEKRERNTKIFMRNTKIFMKVCVQRKILDPQNDLKWPTDIPGSHLGLHREESFIFTRSKARIGRTWF